MENTELKPGRSIPKAPAHYYPKTIFAKYGAYAALPKGHEILNPETPPEEFADALTALISGGFLEGGAFPLPRALVKATA